MRLTMILAGATAASMVGTTSGAEEIQNIALTDPTDHRIECIADMLPGAVAWRNNGASINPSVVTSVDDQTGFYNHEISFQQPVEDIYGRSQSAEITITLVQFPDSPANSFFVVSNSMSPYGYPRAEFAYDGTSYGGEGGPSFDQIRATRAAYAATAEAVVKCPA